MSNELPPLPEAWHGFFGNPHYTADQLREYGRARERAAYERAKQVCLDKAKVSETLAEHYGCVMCAEAIESLGADK